MGALASRRGFTLLEVTITAAIFSVLSVIFLMMMSNALAVSERENTINRMDRDANRALQEIALALRRAVLPVRNDNRPGSSYPNFVYKASDIDALGMPPKRSFQELLNSSLGFGDNGGDWFTLLAAGGDFVPFTVPVDFGGDGDTVDSNFLPELGIVLPGGTHVAAANYHLTPANSPVPALNELRELPMHPFLRNVGPGDFNITPGADPIVVNGAGAERFAETLTFPAGGDQAYAVLRFVTDVDAQGNATVINEWELLAGDGYDLNGDGTVLDSFALGSLQITYATPAGDTPISTWVMGPMVLMQLNTGAAGYKPLFKLVNYGNPANSPNAPVYTGTPIDNRGYALMVQLLVVDWDGQRSPIAFNRKNGIPFLVRQYETVIELRNQSLP